ncbi:hypothetical protein WJX72_005160 [[Myrmecia] bisecta]|uniref:Uncharacterized protein n=1 Tax=[Myrmecia] bisecta TaxID=41462 RepID=A0AAW1QQK2_9CHLO
MLTTVTPARPACLPTRSVPHRHTWRCVCSAGETESRPCKFMLQRRSLLLSATAAATAAVVNAPESRAFDLLPVTERPGALPKGYEDLARKLVQALKESIVVDRDGATENEIRRKADPAKDLVKQWVSKWNGDRIVKDEDSYKQVTAALQELGAFYTKNGQRSRLTKATAESLLAKLQAAEDALPVQDK